MHLPARPREVFKPSLALTTSPAALVAPPPPLLQVGLQSAMMLIPACHIAAGLSLAATEGVIAEEKAKAKAAKSH